MHPFNIFHRLPHPGPEGDGERRFARDPFWGDDERGFGPRGPGRHGFGGRRRPGPDFAGPQDGGDFGGPDHPDGDFGGPGPHHDGRHGGRPGGRHEHRQGARLGRLFAHGDLHVVILHLIAEQPSHGYEIIKAVTDMVGGAYTPSPGTVYPALTMLEDQGYVTVAPTEGGKKLYTVTEEGTAYLAAKKAQIDFLLARMAEFAAERSRGPAPQIVRAIENLRLALRLRLDREPLSDTQIEALAQILDQTAQSIEKV